MKIIPKRDKILKNLIDIAREYCNEFDSNNLNSSLEYFGAVSFSIEVMKKYPIIFTLKEIDSLTIMKTYNKIKCQYQL